MRQTLEMNNSVCLNVQSVVLMRYLGTGIEQATTLGSLIITNLTMKNNYCGLLRRFVLCAWDLVTPEQCQCTFPC
jgi:hypothetical protein